MPKKSVMFAVSLNVPWYMAYPKSTTMVDSRESAACLNVLWYMAYPESTVVVDPGEGAACVKREYTQKGTNSVRRALHNIIRVDGYEGAVVT